MRSGQIFHTPTLAHRAILRNEQVVPLLIVSALMDQTGFASTALARSGMGFQTFIVCVAAMLAWFWLLRNYLAAKLGVLPFRTPLFGVIFGVVLLNEPLSPAFIIGSVLVLAGLLVVNSEVWLPLLHRRGAASHGETSAPDV